LSDKALRISSARSGSGIAVIENDQELFTAISREAIIRTHR